MKKLLSILDSIIAFILGNIIDFIVFCITMSIKFSYKFRKRSIPERSKLIDYKASTSTRKDPLQNYFSKPHSKIIDDSEQQDNDKIYSHDFEEIEEFEKIKGYLTKKAKELGGEINWHQSQDGLIIYLFEFPDTKTFKIFEDIMKDVTLNGIKEDIIDDDIEDMLSEIEGSK